MPKSKRGKVVPLTKTRKKTRDNKERLVGLVRDCCDEFGSAYVFRYENMRNATLKELRDKLHGVARFFLGSNKVLQVALGRTPSDEHRPGLSTLAARLRGDTGLLFTNMERGELETALEEAATAHHARAGTVAEETVELDAGPLMFKGGLPFPHTLEPALRAAGVPSRLNKGVVELLAPHVVCEAGRSLSPGAASVLKMLDLKLATFAMHLDSVWENGELTVISEPPERVAMDAAAFLGDAGDFVLTEVEVDSDGEEARAAMARKGGGKAAAPGGKASRGPEPPAGGKAPKSRKATARS